MLRSIDKWLAGYVASAFRRPGTLPKPCHMIFCLADHFEPFRGGASADQAAAVVNRWGVEYPGLFETLKDADGQTPRHTFFYPQEDYDPQCIDGLAELCKKGLGEVEIHLHHRNDTAEGLREKLVGFRDSLRKNHGLLGSDPAGNVRYGFIHGNWALGNSRPDGDWCGVDNELSVLSETGCYADFTFPSAPSPTQPRIVNAIYRANVKAEGGNLKPEGRQEECRVKAEGRGKAAACADGLRRAKEGGNLKPEERSEVRDQPPSQTGYGAPGRSEGRDQMQTSSGSPLQVSGFIPHPSSMRPAPCALPSSVLQVSGFIPHPSSMPSSLLQVSGFIPHPSLLLLLTGPLGLNWERRKFGILPRLENGALTAVNPPDAMRARLWARQHICVRGREDWVFVKVYTHGCVRENADMLLGQKMVEFHKSFNAAFNDGENWILHYATAREMYNIVRAAEDGMSGNPGTYRDYEISPPPVAQ